MRKISELGLLSILVCAFVRSSFPDFSEATQLCHRCPQIFVKDKNLRLEPPLPKICGIASIVLFVWQVQEYSSMI